MAEAATALAAVDAAEVNGFVGRDMFLQLGERRIYFTAEDFLLSFSLPNFYFHATTAYDILRWKGLAIGKRDFLGKLGRWSIVGDGHDQLRTDLRYTLPLTRS